MVDPNESNVESTTNRRKGNKQLGLWKGEEELLNYSGLSRRSIAALKQSQLETAEEAAKKNQSDNNNNNNNNINGNNNNGGNKTSPPLPSTSKKVSAKPKALVKKNQAKIKKAAQTKKKQNESEDEMSEDEEEIENQGNDEQESDQESEIEDEEQDSINTRGRPKSKLAAKNSKSTLELSTTTISSTTNTNTNTALAITNSMNDDNKRKRIQIQPILPPKTNIRKAPGKKRAATTINNSTTVSTSNNSTISIVKKQKSRKQKESDESSEEDENEDIQEIEEEEEEEELSEEENGLDSRAIDSGDEEIDKFKQMDGDQRLQKEFSIDKILNKRYVKRKVDGVDEEILQVLIKWKDLSYIHCSWVDAEKLNQTKSSRMRLQRFIQKIDEENEDIEVVVELESGNFPWDDFQEVEKILDERPALPSSNKYQADKQYLIKWKSQSYTQSTWEYKEDFKDDLMIEIFQKQNKFPTEEEIANANKPRPPASQWKELSESPNYFLKGNKLRPYQLEGLNWLSFCWYNQINSILGDEMGLGKTVQSVSILETLRKAHNIRGPFLVVAPLTTITHWKREFENWTDMNSLVYHDTGAGRPILRNYEFYFKDKSGKPTNVVKFNVLITTYEMAISDRAYLSKIKWKYLVIDEAHRLKNKHCKLTSELRSYHFDHLLLLTGTPLQNNTQELWALLNFLEPSKFNKLSEFLVEFGDLKQAEQVSKLQKLLKPYLLRRMKERVEKSIAPKEETIVEVELTLVQKKYYRAIYEKNFAFLRKNCKGQQGPSLLNIMMELRKCCNHPYLIKGVEHSETTDIKEKDQVYTKLIQASGKLVLVDKLLPKLKAGGHKVLIFSQMVSVLDILDDYLTYRGYPHERIDGSIKGNDRQAAIDRFSKPDSDRFVFLLCTRAGGIGINLTAADTVIIFDSDWNPQNDLQAQARCHRIGQDKMVKVYRLVTKNTYERLMFDRASKKLGLDRVVLTKMNSLNHNKEEVPDKETINSLLKYGVYAIKEDENVNEKFYEEDIDQILDRSTVINTEVADPMASSFSTASFCSSSAQPQIDVNDPNFWDKFVPELDTKDDLILQPRTRKNVHRFGANEDSSSEESDLEVEDEETEHHQTSRGDGSKTWTAGERNKLKSALLCLGSGRWNTIKTVAGLRRWSVEQIRHYGRALVQKVCTNYNSDREVDRSNRISLEILNALVVDLEPDIHKYYIEKKRLKQEKDREYFESLVKQQQQQEEERRKSELGDTKEVKEEDKMEIDSNDHSSVATTSSSSTAAIENNNSSNNNSGSNNNSNNNNTTITTTTSSSPSPPITNEEVKAPSVLTSAILGNLTFNEPIQEEEVELVREFNESKEDQGFMEFINHPTFNDHYFADYLIRNTKKIARKLHNMAMVAQILKLGYPKVAESLGDLSDPPFPWWKTQLDNDLLIGTYKHGFGEYDLIRNDPVLVFSKYKWRLSDEDDESKEKKEKEKQKEDSMDSSSQDVIINKKDNKESNDNNESEDKDSNGVNNFDSDGNRNSNSKNNNNSSSNSSGNSDSIKNQNQNGLEDVIKWPSSKVLSHRVKRLLRTMEFYKAKMEKEERIERKKQEKEKKQEEKLKRRTEPKVEWTKREKDAFYRCITIYGVQEDKTGSIDWELVKERAGLKKKSTELISGFYYEIYNKCEQAILEEKKSKANTVFNTKEHQNQLKQEKEREKQHPNEQDSNLDDEEEEKEDKDGERGDKKEDLSLVQCKRFISRIQFFSKLRNKVLQLENLEETLKNLPLPHHGFPNWWQTPAHDIALLKGVAQHGYSQFEDICNDNSLPFESIANSLRKSVSNDTNNNDNNDNNSNGRNNSNVKSKILSEDEKKRKRKENILDIINFPKDKAVSKRLDHVVSYAINPPKSGLSKPFDRILQPKDSSNYSSRHQLFNKFNNNHNTSVEKKASLNILLNDEGCCSDNEDQDNNYTFNVQDTRSSKKVKPIQNNQFHQSPHKVSHFFNKKQHTFDSSSDLDEDFSDDDFGGDSYIHIPASPSSNKSMSFFPKNKGTTNINNTLFKPISSKPSNSSNNNNSNNNTFNNNSGSSFFSNRSNSFSSTSTLLNSNSNSGRLQLPPVHSDHHSQPISRYNPLPPKFSSNNNNNDYSDDEDDEDYKMMPVNNNSMFNNKSHYQYNHEDDDEQLDESDGYEEDMIYVPKDKKKN